MISVTFRIAHRGESKHPWKGVFNFSLIQVLSYYTLISKTIEETVPQAC